MKNIVYTTGHLGQQSRDKLSKPTSEWVSALPYPSDIVLAPFLRSGTTMAACIELGRRCTGIEANGEYVEIVKSRLEIIGR